MEKKYDVTALGELLMDFTDYGVSEQGNTVFEANPGGAPCNVLSMVAKCGHKTAFIGKVGNDIFGNRLKEVLNKLSIDTCGLREDEKVRTSLAFVQNSRNGEREFSFYRNPGADMMLQEEELEISLLQNTRIFHFGTLSMTHEPVRSATKKAVKEAKENGALISFDPNLREKLWDSTEDAKTQFKYGMGKCDISKISDDELWWFTGKQDYEEGVEYLQERYDIPLILLSMGAKGSRAYHRKCMAECQPFLNKKTIDTTGAGDTFWGSCLHFVLKYGLENLNEQRMGEMLLFANGAASLITTRKGALRVMPGMEEVYQLIAPKE